MPWPSPVRRRGTWRGSTSAPGRTLAGRGGRRPDQVQRAGGPPGLGDRPVECRSLPLEPSKPTTGTRAVRACSSWRVPLRSASGSCRAVQAVGGRGPQSGSVQAPVPPGGGWARCGRGGSVTRRQRGGSVVKRLLLEVLHLRVRTGVDEGLVAVVGPAHEVGRAAFGSADLQHFPSRTASSTCMLRITSRSPRRRTCCVLLRSASGRGAGRCPPYPASSRRPVEASGSKVPAGGGAVAHAGAVDTSRADVRRPRGAVPGAHAGVGGSGHSRSADRLRLVERAVPAPAPGRGAGAGRGVRGLPHRPALRRRRARRRRRPGSCPATRSSAGRGRAGPGCRASRRRPGRRRLAAAAPAGSAGGAGRGAENLCPGPTYTGWDVDGGYAEYAVVPAAFAYRMPESCPTTEAAPLLCAGIIGYRALRRAQLPPGGRLGIYGFGASAHLTAQIAIAQGAEVHVLTRGAAARELALELGAASAGGAYDAAARAAGRGDPVRAGRATWCRWRSRALDRGGHPGRRRDPPQRHPGAGLPAAPVPGADADAASRPTPVPTARSCCGWRPRCGVRGPRHAVPVRAGGPGPGRPRRRPGHRRGRPHDG